MPSPDATCVIVYRLDGEQREWRIGAHRSKDNEQTLREHLARWIPRAEFVGYRWEEENAEMAQAGEGERIVLGGRRLVENGVRHGPVGPGV